MRAILVSDKFEPNYAPLHESLNNLDFYEPLFLHNIQPNDRLDKVKSTFIAMFYKSWRYLILVNSTRTHLEITLETLNFVWKISIDEDSADVDLEAVGCIQNDLPVS